VSSPIVKHLRVVPVAGRDDMLLNLSGAHAPFFTRNIVIVTDNAGQATIQGANADLVAAITDNDRVELFVEYNDTEYDEFTYETAHSIFGAPIFNPASTSCPVSAPFPGPNFGTLLVTVDCSGRELPRST